MSYNYNCNCGSGMMETDMPWPGMPIPQMYPAGAPCDGGAYAPAVRPVPSASPAPYRRERPYRRIRCRSFRRLPFRLCPKQRARSPKL